MAWSGELTAGCAIGDSVTLDSDTSSTKTYTVSAFRAPKKGVYKFDLLGSGGRKRTDLSGSTGASISNGGAGGKTVGYMMMAAGETVYVGVGGPNSAAFVARAEGENLASIAKEDLCFVAGGGGSGGAAYGQTHNMKSAAGGAGGGETGESGKRAVGGTSDTAAGGGTQEAGGTGGKTNGTYGSGAAGSHAYGDGGHGLGGSGGDGLYGGAAGNRGEGWASGGGGGSGYVYAAELVVNGVTYTSQTQQGGGAESNTNGSAVIEYHAPGDLPIVFDGTRLTGLYYNGVEVKSLIFGGTKVFMRRCAAWLSRCTARAFGYRRATPAW